MARATANPAIAIEFCSHGPWTFVVPTQDRHVVCLGGLELGLGSLGTDCGGSGRQTLCCWNGCVHGFDCWDDANGPSRTLVGCRVVLSGGPTDGTLSGVVDGDREEELLRADARPDVSGEDEACKSVLPIAAKGIGASGGLDVGWLVGETISVFSGQLWSFLGQDCAINVTDGSG